MRPEPIIMDRYFQFADAQKTILCKSGLALGWENELLSHQDS